MSYRREVEALLGKELMTVVVNQLKEGIMTDAQMMEFVLQLGILSKTDPTAPNILLGNHKRRMSRDKDRRWDTEFLEVMDDWWGESLYQMSPSEALETLEKALSHPNVGCKAVVSKLSTTAATLRASTATRSTSAESSVTSSARIFEDPQLQGTSY